MDYGYSCQAVYNAFAQVGITLVCSGPPIADFSASPTYGSVPLTVNFTDQSFGATSWSWNFGDTGTSTQRNPSHIYNSIGTYTVSLTAANSYGSDNETKINYITVTVPYCSSQGNSQANEWISRVRVANLDNSSDASPYSNFTSIIANLTRGTSASVTLNTGYSGTANREYWRIWIDYNHDGDFADSGEQVFSKNGKNYVTGSFTPPGSALTGPTRMRVSMKYGASPTSCETFSYGEVEDYTANIQ
jgi:PKD repeat protein